MTGIVVALVVWAAILTLCCLVLGRHLHHEKPEDPKPHPCDTCTRWWECNGIDSDCPLLKEVEENGEIGF